MEIYKKAVNYFSDKYQLILMAEESSELVQTVTKFLRNQEVPRKSEEELLEHIAEEMADVYVSMNHIKLRYNLYDKIDNYIKEKEIRLEERMK